MGAKIGQKNVKSRRGQTVFLRMMLLLLMFSIVGCKVAVESSGGVNSNTSIDPDSFFMDVVSDSIDETTTENEENTEPTMSKIEIDDCQSGAISVQFNDHVLTGTSIDVNGDVLRTYNNSECSILNSGDSFFREHDLVFSSMYRKAKLYVKSEEKMNYLNNPIGGGEVLTKTNSGWQIDVLGKNETLVSNSGKTFFDVSIQTSQPLQVVGTLHRSQRLVESGEFLVFHNLAQYTTTLTLEQLQWTEECRCPVSGVIHAQYLGQRLGTAEYEFQGCGRVEMTASNAVKRILKLNRCQL
jgi:hypothetical protein